MPQDEAKLKVLRQQTKWFIDDDPFEIVLTPKIKTRQPGGGFSVVAGEPRSVQRVKLIYTGSARGSGGVEGGQVTADGVERRYDYVILGMHDVEWAIGDSWVDRLGNQCEITGFIPDNEYERRATASIFGRRAEGG